MTDEREKCLKKLQYPGEEDVRAKLAANHFGLSDSKRSHWVQEWLHEKAKANNVAESSEGKQNEHASQTDGVEPPISRDQTKNTSVVKTALLLGCISLIIFSVPFCSSSPG